MTTSFESDITQYYRSYFPERNGVLPDVKLNENFTNETLKYMSKPWSAKFIADTIKEFTQGKHYFLFELCAGTGGNTVEFLSRPEVAMTISFEKEPDRAMMLRRNINAYHLGGKAIVFNEEVKGTNQEIEDFKDYKDAIFFIDAPWLPQNLKNAKSNYKSQYILENMKIGNLTLENWLLKLKNIAYMVVLKQPPKYRLKSVPGWTYYKHNINRIGKPKSDDKNGILYVCVNNSFIEGVPDNRFGGFMNKSELISKMLPLSEDLAHKYENFVEMCNSKTFEEAKEDHICQKFVKYY